MWRLLLLRRSMSTRSKIPTRVREAVWRKRNGALLDGTCHCCHCSLDFLSFHCGHVVSHASGGAATLDNLEPVCSVCNLNMGSMNLLIYREAVQRGLF